MIVSNGYCFNIKLLNPNAIMFHVKIDIEEV